MADKRSWESYSDSKILYLRPLAPRDESAYEYVAVCEPIDEEPGMMELHHGAVYVDDYFTPEAKQTLDELLSGFGFAGLEGFVKETAETDGQDWVRLSDGTVDTAKSPSWFIDRMMLASLIVECKILDEGGIRMNSREAERVAGGMVGEKFAHPDLS